MSSFTLHSLSLSLSHTHTHTYTHTHTHKHTHHTFTHILRNKLTMIELAKSEVKRILRDSNESLSTAAVNSLASYVVHGGFVAAQQRMMDDSASKGLSNDGDKNDKGKLASDSSSWGEFNG